MILCAFLKKEICLATFVNYINSYEFPRFIPFIVEIEYSIFIKYIPIYILNK